MHAAANIVLLASIVAFLNAGYRLGWTETAEPAHLPPNLAAAHAGLRRMYRASIGLALVACLLMIVHLGARDVMDVGAWATEYTLGGAVLLAVVAVWFLVSARSSP